MDFVEKKIRDVNKARNYQYKTGEISEIADRRFERALKAKDLSEFPNVSYHHKMRVLAKDEKQ